LANGNSLVNEKQLKEKAIKLQSQYAAITANEIALLIVYELNTRDKRNPIGQFVRRSPREFTFKVIYWLLHHR
jgi:hypothetical protein